MQGVPGFISSMTDAVLAEVGAWQARTLEPMYTVVFVEALRVEIREDVRTRRCATGRSIWRRAIGLARLLWAIRILQTHPRTVVLEGGRSRREVEGGHGWGQVGHSVPDKRRICLRCGRLAGHELSGLPIGANRRRTAASEISSPPTDVEQRQVYLETGHRRHELRGARMAGTGREPVLASGGFVAI